MSQFNKSDIYVFRKAKSLVYEMEKARWGTWNCIWDSDELIEKMGYLAEMAEHMMLGDEDNVLRYIETWEAIFVEVGENFWEWDENKKWLFNGWVR